MGIVEKPKLFMNNNDFKPKSMEEVVITCIVSPDKFFVRKVGKFDNSLILTSLILK